MKLSCFHVKGAFLSVCFSGYFKLFTMQEGFQSRGLCVCVDETKHLTMDDARQR